MTTYTVAADEAGAARLALVQMDSALLPKAETREPRAAVLKAAAVVPVPLMSDRIPAVCCVVRPQYVELMSAEMGFTAAVPRPAHRGLGALAPAK